MSEQLELLRSALPDRYAIERELGRGGMATVYLAFDEKQKRQVAIKVLRPELSASIGVQRFLREIELTAQLVHPHILPLLESGKADDILYYVMPYVEGETLRDRLKREGQLPIEDSIQTASEVAEALAYAHSLGVIHRDIKPENIFLAAGQAVIGDFGIARAISEAGGDRLTETGLAMGTPAYMSPEQAMGRTKVDNRTDIYSLGCVIYEMLGGDPPFSGSTPQSILARKVTDQIPSLRSVRETVPEAFENVVLKALARSPADRFATATLLAEALKDPATVTPVRTRVVRMPRAVIGAAAVLVLVVAIALWLLLKLAPTSFAPATRRQLTFVGDIGNVALSPDGEMLAYTRYRCRDATTCGEDLFVQDFPGGEPLEIAIAWSDLGKGPRTQWFFNVEWSPDGRDILLMPGGSLPGNPAGLYTIPRLGGPVRQLAQELVTSAMYRPGEEFIDWIEFPKGFGGGPPVWRSLDLRSGDTTSRTLPVFANGLRWSRDGRWLAVAGGSWGQGGGSTLYAILDQEGSVRDTLRSGTENWPGVGWSPTGDGLFFRVGIDLFRVGVDRRTGRFEGDPHLAVDDLVGAESPGFQPDFAVSEDGHSIFFARLEQRGEFQTIVRSADATSGTSWGAGSASLNHPAVSPDGGLVAYTRPDQRGTNIYVQTFDGGTPRALTATPGQKAFLNWSPDGSRLAFIGSEEGASWLTTVNQTGGRLLRLARVSGGLDDFVWLPDAERLAYISEFGDLRVTDLEGRTLMQMPLPYELGVRWGLWISPTGDSVATLSHYFPTSGELTYVVHVSALDTAAGEWGQRTLYSQSEVLRNVEIGRAHPLWYRTRTLTWTEDGDLLLAPSIHTGLNVSTGVWELPSTGGPPVLLLDLATSCGPSRVSMSADGSRLACAGRQGAADIWVLEDSSLVRR